jgi:hypothetical protein
MVKLVGGDEMQNITYEITREYRLDFDNGEPGWEDRIPAEITSGVLGRHSTCVINRTSLLAWALMKMPEVQVADLACGGWIKIVISTGPGFDEVVFRREVAEVLAGVKKVRGDQRQRPGTAPRATWMLAASGGVGPRTPGRELMEVPL